MVLPGCGSGIGKSKFVGIGKSVGVGKSVGIGKFGGISIGKFVGTGIDSTCKFVVIGIGIDIEKSVYHGIDINKYVGNFSVYPEQPGLSSYIRFEAMKI